MMIKYVEGDIRNAEEQLIAHGCNAQGVMGSGVAAVVRQVWPEAYEEYINAGVWPMGYIIFAESRGKVIANCITQKNYGRDNKRYVDYCAVAKAFKFLNGYMAHNNIDELAMPKIGAGLGGGSWEAISTIIQDSFDDKVTVVIYELAS